MTVSVMKDIVYKLRNIYAFVLCVSICLSAVACGGDGEIDASAVTRISEACEANVDRLGKASFRLNMTFSEQNVTLLFAQGSYTVSADENGAKSVAASMSQTVLGTPSAVTVKYADGKCVTVIGEAEAETSMTEQEFFSSITYAPPVVPSVESVKSIAEDSTALGNGYTLRLKDAEATALLVPLIGEGVYTLAKLREPIKQQTCVKNASITYILGAENGAEIIKSVAISFSLFVYDTPPYVPGGAKPDADDYTLEIKTQFSKTYE